MPYQPLSLSNNVSKSELLRNFNQLVTYCNDLEAKMGRAISTATNEGEIANARHPFSTLSDRINAEFFKPKFFQFTSYRIGTDDRRRRTFFYEGLTFFNQGKITIIGNGQVVLNRRKKYNLFSYNEETKEIEVANFTHSFSNDLLFPLAGSISYYPFAVVENANRKGREIVYGTSIQYDYKTRTYPAFTKSAYTGRVYRDLNPSLYVLGAGRYSIVVPYSNLAPNRVHFLLSSQGNVESSYPVKVFSLTDRWENENFKNCSFVNINQDFVFERCSFQDCQFEENGSLFNEYHYGWFYYKIISNEVHGKYRIEPYYLAVKKSFPNLGISGANYSVEVDDGNNQVITYRDERMINQQNVTPTSSYSATQVHKEESRTVNAFTFKSVECLRFFILNFKLDFAALTHLGGNTKENITSGELFFSVAYFGKKTFIGNLRLVHSFHSSSAIGGDTNSIRVRNYREKLIFNCYTLYSYTGSGTVYCAGDYGVEIDFSVSRTNDVNRLQISLKTTVVNKSLPSRGRNYLPNGSSRLRTKKIDFTSRLSLLEIDYKPFHYEYQNSQVWKERSN